MIKQHHNSSTIRNSYVLSLLNSINVNVAWNLTCCRLFVVVLRRTSYALAWYLNRNSRFLTSSVPAPRINENDLAEISFVLHVFCDYIPASIFHLYSSFWFVSAGSSLSASHSFCFHFILIIYVPSTIASSFALPFVCMYVCGYFIVCIGASFVGKNETSTNNKAV